MKPFAGLLAGLLLLVSVVPYATAQSTEADVHVGQALLEFDDRQYDAALANLRRALKIEPYHVAALYYTGLVHLAQRRPAEAVGFLERARATAPTGPAVALQLGLAYFATERYDRAEPLLEEVFRAQPTLDGLGSYVGFMRYRTKDYRGALRAFPAGRATDPELRQLARLYTGLSLAALGLPSEAATEVEQATRARLAADHAGSRGLPEGERRAQGDDERGGDSRSVQDQHELPR